MRNQTISVLAFCFFLAIACIGCVNISYKSIDEAYQVQLIDPGSAAPFNQRSSGKKLYLYSGDVLAITTKEKIMISTRKVDWVKMVLAYADTSGLKGNVEYVTGDEGQEREDVSGQPIEVALENIKNIQVMKSNKRIPSKPSSFQRAIGHSGMFLKEAAAIVGLILVLALIAL